MSTYAGYQRYETPNLGEIASKALDAITEREEKQRLLSEQQKAKNEAAAAKAAKESGKEQKKEEEKGQAERQKFIEKVSVPTSGIVGIDQAGFAFKEKMIGQYDDMYKKVKSGEMRKEDLDSWAASIGNSFSNLQKNYAALNTAIDERSTKGSLSPYVNFTMEKGAASVSPSKSAPLNIMMKDGQFLVQRQERYPTPLLTAGETYPVGAPVDLSSVGNIANVVSQPDVDFDKLEDEGPMKVGLQEVGIGGVDQAKSDAFTKASNVYTSQILNGINPQKTTDALFHYQPDKHFILVDKNTPEEVKKKLLKENGGSENGVEIVDMDQREDGTFAPDLTDSQKKDLKEAIEKRLKGKAKKEIVNPPSEGKGGGGAESKQEERYDSYRQNPDILFRALVDSGHAAELPANWAGVPGDPKGTALARERGYYYNPSTGEFQANILGKVPAAGGREERALRSTAWNLKNQSTNNIIRQLLK